MVLILKGNIGDLEINGDKTLTAAFSEKTERALSISDEGEGAGWWVNLFEVSPLKK